MSHNNPDAVAWWLVSRAAGIVALALITISVLTGLARAAGAVKSSKLKRFTMQLHELLALTSIAAIAVHGIALLGDHWLKPGLSGIAVPGAISYRPTFTALGIVGAYLAVLLGPSFYLRRRIGARRWRKVHRAILIVWLMSAVHTLGAGSDATTVWLRAIVFAPMPPIVYLATLRVLDPSGARTRSTTRPRPRAMREAAVQPGPRSQLPLHAKAADEPTY